MLGRRVIAATICLALSPWGPSAAQTPRPDTAAVVPASSYEARELVERVKPSVIQIKGFFGDNTAEAFHGSGFAVAADGLFVTNYHVVSEKVHHPAKYRLEYRTPDGRTGPIAILAIDVRHDLALVRAEGHAPSPLDLDVAIPDKGARAFSIGFPLDVGLTITEGVSNGLVTDSFGPRIHYSGAINGGMSGGPALGRDGRVIGVNVSGYRFEQLVAFLVPAEHVAALRDAVPEAPPDPEALRAAMTAQLQAHSQALMSALSGSLKTSVTSGFSLPAKIAPFVDCKARGSTNKDDPVQRESINCATKSGLYLRSGVAAGDIQYQHTVLTTDKLGGWRFARQLSATARGFGNSAALRDVGPFVCEGRVTALRGFDARVQICSRSRRKHEGLYDFAVRVVSVSGATRGFRSSLDMGSMQFGPALDFIERYLSSMESKP